MYQSEKFVRSNNTQKKQSELFCKKFHKIYRKPPVAESTCTRIYILLQKVVIYH